MAVAFREKRDIGRVVELGPTEAGTLSLRLEIEPLGAGLIRRTLVVTASSQRNSRPGGAFLVANNGVCSTFSSEEKSHVVCDSLGGGPEYPSVRGESIPVAMAAHIKCRRRSAGRFAGAVGKPLPDRARSDIARRLSVMCGDGRDARELRVVHEPVIHTSARSMAGNHWLRARLAASTRGSSQAPRFRTTTRNSPPIWRWPTPRVGIRPLWRRFSGTPRTSTCVVICLRGGQEEGRFIFISGIGYGWKQWVSSPSWVRWCCTVETCGQAP